ncbi:MAG: hypothetical protein HUJ70_10710 [Pseudobutyrivibrio sp.]|nr:hypothetical protein [Pseudobutyrivibrio sp.]
MKRKLVSGLLLLCIGALGGCGVSKMTTSSVEIPYRLTSDPHSDNAITVIEDFDDLYSGARISKRQMEDILEYTQCTIYAIKDGNQYKVLSGYSADGQSHLIKYVSTDEGETKIVENNNRYVLHPDQELVVFSNDRNWKGINGVDEFSGIAPMFLTNDEDGSFSVDDEYTSIQSFATSMLVSGSINKLEAGTAIKTVSLSTSVKTENALEIIGSDDDSNASYMIRNNAFDITSDNVTYSITYDDGDYAQTAEVREVVALHTQSLGHDGEYTFDQCFSYGDINRVSNVMRESDCAFLELDGAILFVDAYENNGSINSLIQRDI